MCGRSPVALPVGQTASPWSRSRSADSLSGPKAVSSVCKVVDAASRFEVPVAVGRTANSTNSGNRTPARRPRFAVFRSFSRLLVTVSQHGPSPFEMPCSIFRGSCARCQTTGQVAPRCVAPEACPALAHRRHLLLAPRPTPADADDPPARRLCTHSAFRTPYSAFRTPHSLFRTPHSALPIPHSLFPLILATAPGISHSFLNESGSRKSRFRAPHPSHPPGQERAFCAVLGRTAGPA
jgi:hypothetical protein